MIKFFFNLTGILIIVGFFIITFNYYNSEKNIKSINNNRGKITNKILENVNNLPILKNDTDKVVEFNSGYQNEEKKIKRNFWDLFSKWKEKQ